MKSAYELAMERLNQKAPTRKLTDDQKARIAEIESLYKARIAEREVNAQDQIARAMARNDMVEVDQVKAELARERQKLEEEAEAKKEAVRNE